MKKLSVERGCSRLGWRVLDWNETAINFYKRIGTRPMDEWAVSRVDGENLEKLAAITPLTNHHQN